MDAVAAIRIGVIKAVKRGLIVFIVLFLAACTTARNYAPVVDVSGYEAIPKNGRYKVAAGDTLYSIAWRYGFDYQTLAKRNRINPPYEIKVNQIIYLKGSKPRAVATFHTGTVSRQDVKPRKAVMSEREPNYHVAKWHWPTRGRVIRSYSSKSNGISIKGRPSQSVLAAAPGKVVYAGNGLRGYGNLVIIKHNRIYLSAYANNKKLYVKAGQWVHQGQKIAQIGSLGGNKNTLHFEIRRYGKSVNPLKLLS